MTLDTVKNYIWFFLFLNPIISFRSQTDIIVLRVVYKYVASECAVHMGAD